MRLSTEHASGGIQTDSKLRLMPQMFGTLPTGGLFFAQLFLSRTFESLLGSAALILSVVNGLFLARFYTRDRARLRVYAVHPEAYQWWFRLPDGLHDGMKTRKFGFLVYLDASNPGLRPTTLDEWRLWVLVANSRWEDLKPLSIPQPDVELGAAATRSTLCLV